MLQFFIVIILLLLILAIFLAASVGVAFGLVWMFPAISFEIGVLIGTISVAISCNAFIGLVNVFRDRDSHTTEDENDKSYKIYDEIDLDNIILTRSTRSRKKRR